MRVNTLEMQVGKALAPCTVTQRSLPRDLAIRVGWELGLIVQVLCLILGGRTALCLLIYQVWGEYDTRQGSQ